MNLNVTFTKMFSVAVLTKAGVDRQVEQYQIYICFPIQTLLP